MYAKVGGGGLGGGGRFVEAINVCHSVLKVPRRTHVLVASGG